MAGLKPGDLIVRWSREADLPANPRAADGEIQGPFDMEEAQIEQAPRGRLTLTGFRQGTPMKWVMPQDDWEVETRPRLEPALEHRYQEGLRLVGDNKVRQAAALWRALGTDARDSGHALLAAWIAYRTAQALTKAHEGTLADAEYAAANQGLKDLGLAGPRAQALRAWGRALHRRKDSRSRTAEVFAEAMECEQARDPDSLAAARTQLWLARAEYWRSNFVVAAALTRRVLALQEQEAPRSAAIAETLAELADRELREWRIDIAQEYVDRLFKIRDAISPDGVGMAKDLVFRAWLAYGRGDLRAALEGFQRALARLEGLIPESRDTAFVLAGIGNTRMRLGDLPGADEALRRSLQLYDLLFPEGDAQGSLLYGLGQVALDRRDLEMAQSHYRRSLAVFLAANPDSPEMPIALHGLGDVALEREDFAEAERYLRQSVALNEKRGPESERTAWDLRCLALALAGKGDVEGAREMAERSLRIRERLVPGSYEVGYSLATLAHIAFTGADWDESLKRYEQSLVIRSRQTPGSVVEAESLYGIGRVRRKQGELPGAAESFSAAVSILEQQSGRLGGGTEARFSFGAGYSRCFRDYLEVLLELGRPETAFHVLERSRARGLLALLAERSPFTNDAASAALVQRLQANHAAYDTLQAELSRLKPGQDRAETERLHGRLRELREDAGEIIARLREVSPRAAALRYPEPLDLANTRAALDRGTSLLAYSVGETDTALFVVKGALAPGRGLAVYSLPIGRIALRERVERFRRLLESPGQDIAAEAAELYRLLVRPAEAALASSERLVISPDGALHLLPFASLLRVRDRGRGHQYLVEWKPLHVVASATVYAEIKKGRDATGAGARLALAAFGDPRFPESTQDGPQSQDGELRRLRERGVTLVRLPSTREEVRAIAALYPHARTFLGADATESQLKAVASQARYLHIASHAVLDEGLPLNSGLALTVPARIEPGRDNGLLQAWEIFDGPTMQADLVTLSACKTALGKDMGGEGLLGLTRAFQYAGARSVLASLWSVADRSTARLMRSFYGHLVAGKSKDEALRAAQGEMLRAGGPTSHPRHWAAFQLFGDWK